MPIHSVPIPRSNPRIIIWSLLSVSPRIGSISMTFELTIPMHVWPRPREEGWLALSVRRQVLEGWLAQWRKRRLVRFGALGSAWPDSASSDSKSPQRIFRRGLNSCDDEDMPVICPTSQNVFAGSLKRPDHATLHGVVLDIFVERSIHGSETMLGRSDSGHAARRAQRRGILRRRAKMGG
jgi:hypothetical protein